MTLLLVPSGPGTLGTPRGHSTRPREAAFPRACWRWTLMLGTDGGLPAFLSYRLLFGAVPGET